MGNRFYKLFYIGIADSTIAMPTPTYCILFWNYLPSVPFCFLVNILKYDFMFFGGSISVDNYLVFSGHISISLYSVRNDHVVLTSPRNKLTFLSVYLKLLFGSCIAFTDEIVEKSNNESDLLCVYHVQCSCFTSWSSAAFKVGLQHKLSLTTLEHRFLLFLRGLLSLKSGKGISYVFPIIESEYLSSIHNFGPSTLLWHNRLLLINQQSPRFPSFIAPYIMYYVPFVSSLVQT